MSKDKESKPELREKIRKLKSKVVRRDVVIVIGTVLLAAAGIVIKKQYDKINEQNNDLDIVIREVRELDAMCTELQEEVRWYEEN